MTVIKPTSETVHLNDTDFCVHTWSDPNAATTKAVVVVFHGFLAHGLYPTVRYAAELLSSNGYTVVAPDFRGHGKSSGLQGYLPSRDQVVTDGVSIARHAMQSDKKTFLLGSSMGGTIALSVALVLKDEVAGVALLAPMLMLSVGAPARSLLYCLACVGAGTLQVIPSSSTNAESQYRDPAKLKECEDDPLIVKSSSIRIGSASTCVELAGCIQDEFDKITTPFLVMVADEDVVVNNQGDFDLVEKAPATDKTMKRYPALHGLLCEESPLVDTIQKDLLEWIQARS